MQTVTVGELQHNLSLYLKKAKNGDEIIVEENNEVIARILPFNSQIEEQILVENGFMTLPKIVGRFLGNGRSLNFIRKDCRNNPKRTR